MQEMQETWVWFLGQEDLLEKEMATHSSILAWEIPWIEELSRLQSMESQTTEQLSTHARSYCFWTLDKMSNEKKFTLKGDVLSNC